MYVCMYVYIEPIIKKKKYIYIYIAKTHRKSNFVSRVVFNF